MTSQAETFIVATFRIPSGSELNEDIVSGLAWSAGCLGLETPLDPDSNWRVFFASSRDADSFKRALDALSGRPDAIADWEINEQLATNWMDGWRKHFRPTPVGESFIVTPPWERPAQHDPHRTLLLIDPGMAFGTGTHPTTQLCMELAEPHLQTGLRVLDIGAGSGILLLAALKRGAALGVGIDFDADCIDNFRHNMALNGFGVPQSVQQKVLFIRGDGATPILPFQFDLIFANMLADRLESVLAQVNNLKTSTTSNVSREPSPLIIASGILTEEWPALKSKWPARFHLEVIEERYRDEWMAFSTRFVFQ